WITIVVVSSPVFPRCTRYSSFFFMYFTYRLQSTKSFGVLAITIPAPLWPVSIVRHTTVYSSCCISSFCVQNLGLLSGYCSFILGKKFSLLLHQLVREGLLKVINSSLQGELLPQLITISDGFLINLLPSSLRTLPKSSSARAFADLLPFLYGRIL